MHAGRGDPPDRRVSDGPGLTTADLSPHHVTARRFHVNRKNVAAMEREPPPELKMPHCRGCPQYVVLSPCSLMCSTLGTTDGPCLPAIRAFLRRKSSVEQVEPVNHSLPGEATMSPLLVWVAAEPTCHPLDGHLSSTDTRRADQPSSNTVNTLKDNSSGY